MQGEGFVPVVVALVVAVDEVGEVPVGVLTDRLDGVSWRGVSGVPIGFLFFLALYPLFKLILFGRCLEGGPVKSLIGPEWVTNIQVTLKKKWRPGQTLKCLRDRPSL